MERYDIVIIGTGPAGLSAAWASAAVGASAVGARYIAAASGKASEDRRAGEQAGSLGREWGQASRQRSQP